MFNPELPEAPKGIIISELVAPSTPPDGLNNINLNVSIEGVLYITRKSSADASGSSPPFESLPTIAVIVREFIREESIGANAAHLIACPDTL